MEKATTGISQQKKAMMKQRVMSSVSIFLISPYLIMRIPPIPAIPTTTIDQPNISHLKKSDNDHLVIDPAYRWDSTMTPVSERGPRR